MILEAIITAVVAVLSALGDLFPEMDTPAFIGSISSQISSVTGQMAPLGNWVPFGAAGTALQLVLAAIAIAIVVKVVRIIASFLTAGGGSAA